jgi:toxin ParE1/3/4
VRLEWSRFALADRDAIFDYIEGDNPRAAVAVDDRIRIRIGSLLEFPESGRPGRIAGTRELVIAGTPYIAAYIIIGDTIRILRILHSTQLWPEDLPEE